MSDPSSLEPQLHSRDNVIVTPLILDYTQNVSWKDAQSRLISWENPCERQVLDFIVQTRKSMTS